MKPVILLGSGGHASVLLESLEQKEIPVLGVVTPQYPSGSRWQSIEVLGDDDILTEYSPERVDLVNGVGSLPGDERIRQRLFEQFSEQGFRFQTVIDKAAIVASRVDFSVGVQIMAGVVIQAGTEIASNTIVNTGAIIDHDCRIGRHVHIAPGAMLSGGVEIADNVHVGTGATLIQGIKVGEGTVIGAGCVINQNVPAGHIVYPARSFFRSQD